MEASDAPLDCVAFMLIRDDALLVERRSSAKRVDPGILAIPGGHLEPGETIEAALRRELAEELGVRAVTVQSVCILLHQSEELRRLHYFAVTDWEGEIVSNEADAVEWIAFEEIDRLDLVVERDAVKLYRLGRP